MYINTLKWLKFLKDEWHFSRQFMRCIHEDHTNDVDLCLKSFIALNLRTILLFNQSYVNQTWQHDYWCFGVTWHQFLNGIVLTYVWPQVISCETKASACDHTLHANYWRGFWVILAILAVKSTPESLRICFILTEFSSMDLNAPIIKVWGRAPRAQRPLMTGNVTPVVRSTTWRNNDSSTRNGSRFEYRIRILRGKYSFSRVEIENAMS